MYNSVKAVEFVGSSLDDLRAFPLGARRACGYQIEKVQRGRDPDDWKPMSSVGPGARELRVRSDDGAYRVIYIASFADAVYVLHCLQKKSQKTAKSDIELARTRLRKLREGLK
ncbi:MAG: type II toxin-antitoxin system RelE/ParE family toxin [Burkholderiales bacterium]